MCGFTIWWDVTFCRWLWDLGFQIIRQSGSTLIDKKYFPVFLPLCFSKLWNSSCPKFLCKQISFSFTYFNICNHYSKSAIPDACHQQCCGYWEQKNLGNAAWAVRNYYFNAHCYCRSCVELPFIENCDNSE